MVCPNPEVLAAAVEGRIEPAEREAVLNHAALCDDCRHSLLILRAIAPAQARPVLRFRPWMPWAAAAVFILSVAALVRWGREQASVTPPPVTIRVTPPKEPDRREPVLPPAPKPPTPVVPKPEQPKPTPAPTIIEPAPTPTPAPKPTPETPVKPEEPAPVKPAPTPEPPRPTTVAVVATLEKMEGDVLVGKVPAKAGQPIRHGEGLETRGARSWAVISYPDKTRVELEGDTLVRELLDRDAAKGRRLFVEKGAVKADVSKQPAGQPMVFDSPHGEARVLGTTLRFHVDPDPRKGTRLEVEEGKVELKNLAGRSALVESGHFAIAAAGASPTTKRLPKEETILAYDFEDGKKPGAVVVGTVDRGPDRSGNRFCAAGEGDSSSKVMISTDQALFTCTGDEVLSFDYWVDAQAGSVNFHFWNSTQKLAHEYEIPKVVFGKWTRVTVRLDEFGPAGVRAKEGDFLNGLYLQGTGGGPRKFYVDNIVITRPRSLKPRPVETK
jgi:hypothetical protein